MSAQDTEAIRAALTRYGASVSVALTALDRLVARLEAAERERDEAQRRESQRMNAIPAFRRGYQVGQEELAEAHAAELGWDGATTALERAREREQRGLNLANAANGIRGCEAVRVYDQDAAYSGMKEWAEALVAERDRLVARLEAAERALAFYADESTYQEGTGPHPRHFATGVIPIKADLGARARAALAAAAPGETTEPE